MLPSRDREGAIPGVPLVLASWYRFLPVAALFIVYAYVLSILQARFLYG
jgi:hypothetical protein